MHLWVLISQLVFARLANYLSFKSFTLWTLSRIWIPLPSSGKLINNLAFKWFRQAPTMRYIVLHRLVFNFFLDFTFVTSQIDIWKYTMKACPQQAIYRVYCKFCLDQIITFFFRHNKTFHFAHLRFLRVVRDKYMHVFFMWILDPLSIRLKLVLRAPGLMIPLHGAN